MSGVCEIGRRFQTSRTIGGVAYTLTYDRENRLTAISGTGTSAGFVYDAAGRVTELTLTDRAQVRLTWDSENRLVATTGPGARPASPTTPKAVSAGTYRIGTRSHPYVSFGAGMIQWRWDARTQGPVNP